MPSVGDVPKSVDTRSLRPCLGIEPLRDGVVDERGALLLEEFDLPLLLFDKRVDSSSLVVKEDSDNALFCGRHHRYFDRSKVAFCNMH